MTQRRTYMSNLDNMPTLQLNGGGQGALTVSASTMTWLCRKSEENIVEREGVQIKMTDDHYSLWLLPLNYTLT